MRFLAILLLIGLAVALPARAQEATIKALDGDVEVQVAPAKDFVAAKVGDKLKAGDFISTGYESLATLAFEDNSEVRVTAMTQLCIDEFLTKENRTKTQLYLRVGSVQAKVKHTASIRSDFSVVTPTCTASVRGSEERVTYLPGFGTTVEYLEGLGLARDARGAATQLKANDTAKVSHEGKLATPAQVLQGSIASDFTPMGIDASERSGTGGYGRIAVRPDADPTSPRSIVDRVGAHSDKSLLIFRYELLPHSTER